jgi:type II secretory pathway component PulF
MPLYRYDSYNRRGGKASGTIDAASIAVAKELLRGQGLMPTTVEEVRNSSSDSFLAGLFEKPVDVKMVILFTKQLSVLLRSAVPLLEAVDLLVDQFEGKFKRVLISIKDAVKTGESLAKELSKHPKIFSNVYIQLIKAGEASGKLEPILESLVSYLERTEETKKKVQKAMRSPLMTLSFAVLVIVGLLTVLVPKLTAMFKNMKQELPIPTRILIAISDALTKNYIVLGVSITTFFIVFGYWKSTAKGKYQWDAWMLNMPLINYFARTKAVVQFSKTLGMLMESGVNLSEALDIVCNIVENRVLTVKLNNARDKIIKEGKIAKYLSETGIFPKIALYMISTGEQSGKLGQMLLTVGNDYEAGLAELSDGLTEKINPIMTMFMALVVGFIVISIFMPMMSMGDMVK